LKIDLNNIDNELAAIVGEYGTEPGAVIPILQAVQKKYNYLPEPALRRICEITEITPASITGISTFYSQFRHTPVGEHIINVCTGTACHVKGAELVFDAFSRELDIKEGRDTDPRGKFTLQRIACLGCCTIAPVIQIDDITYGHVKPDGAANILQDFLANKGKKQGLETHDGILSGRIGEIKIGLGSCCVASGSHDVHQELQKNLTASGIQTNVKRVGCVGMCHRVPLLEINLPDKEPVLYDKVAPQDVKGILLKHYTQQSFRRRWQNRALDFVENLLYDHQPDQPERFAKDYRDPNIEAFLNRQKRIATEYCGELDPLDLDEYKSKGGFAALEKILAGSSSREVIEQVIESGLRGRGGAGFPTGQKWKIAAQVKDERKFIICNGDEGDPGAFMDRMILESYPYRVIEGMLIAAYASGASEGYFYIRAEYPLAVSRVRKALEICREAGLLGENILGSSFSLQLNIMEGAGAFVCGEESALIASIEGKRGMPSLRPPYPVNKGLWGHSTLVNNCETYAAVPWIFRNGSDSFFELGTEKSKGTKVFSLAGKVARGGLIEVPMGITIREVVEEIGGGIEGGREFKAVQIGGPSGGCVPAELADTQIDFDELSSVGAMMGSGGLLVMDENDCMVDIARYFLTFTCDQSCGKCTFCRIGTRVMLDILDKLCSGKGTAADLEKLEQIAAKTKTGSLCGLGKTAPNPILTTLEYFREEYEAHINGVCPAGRCQDLITYTITDNCIGCTICAQKCPVKAIPITPYEKHEIIQDLCTKCDTCKQVCPNEAVLVK